MSGPHDPGDEHRDAPVAVAEPDEITRLIADGIADGTIEVIHNPAVWEMLHYRDYMEACCVDCARVWYDDDGA